MSEEIIVSPYFLRSLSTLLLTCTLAWGQICYFGKPLETSKTKLETIYVPVWLILNIALLREHHIALPTIYATIHSFIHSYM